MTRTPLQRRVVACGFMDETPRASRCTTPDAAWYTTASTTPRSAETPAPSRISKARWRYSVERMTERLRVGMLAPIAWRVPPLHYGPWERVVSMLTEGLVARGLDVTLFATANSVTRARLSSVAPQGYAENSTLDAKVYECLHIAQAFEQAAR